VNVRDLLHSLLRLLIPIAAALLIGGLLVWSMGRNPLDLYRNLWWGAFGTLGNTLTTLRWATPLILSGLAVTVAYRAGLLNMGGDEPIYMGALAAALVGVELAAPMAVHLPLAILASCLAGALFALIPAILRIYYNVNEIVTTLMFNYIGTLLTDYLVLVIYFGGDPTRALLIQTPRVAATASIARFVARYPLTWAIVVSVGVAVLMAVLLKRTVWGYELETTGANPEFARYIGVRTRRVMLSAFVSPDIALFPQVRLPFADALPLLGRLLGGNNWLFFLAYLSVPVLHVMLYHTRVGLRIRAVGEYPAAALSPWRPSSSAARRPWACCWRRCSSAWPSRPPSASKARAHQRSSS